MSKESFERHYTTKQVAEILQVHPQTVRNLIHKGRMRAINLSGSGGGRGSAYRISASALRDFLSAQTMCLRKDRIHEKVFHKEKEIPP